MDAIYLTESMTRRFVRWSGGLLMGLTFVVAVGVLIFDLRVVRPAVAKVEAALQTAAPSELQPPAPVTDLFRRAYGERLPLLLARRLPLLEPTQVDDGDRTLRVLSEGGLAVLLPLHLSRAEVEGAYFSTVYMGPGTQGLASASQRHLDVPLAEITTAKQAARLVAISEVPSIYLQNMERLERRVANLLKLPAQ